MKSRLLAFATCLAFLSSACGSSAPTAPTTPVTPPVDPVTPTPPAPPPPTLGITKILAFGDSMTEGTTSAQYTPFALTAGKSESYPFKLQTLLTGRYTAQAIVVSNAGIGGKRATEDRDRFAHAMSDAQPQVVLLMEGANDLNLLSVQGLTDVDPVVGAMEDMVRDALARGAQVMVATIPPERPGGKGTPSLVPKYNSNLKLMASKKGATLVDVNALLPISVIGQDGLHLTEDGYQMLAQIFMDAIKGKYESASATSALSAASAATAARR